MLPNKTNMPKSKLVRLDTSNSKTLDNLEDLKISKGINTTSEILAFLINNFKKKEDNILLQKKQISILQKKLAVNNLKNT